MFQTTEVSVHKMKNNLFVCGGSHAVRLAKAFEKNADILKIFTVISLAKSGQISTDISLPPRVEKGDLVFIQTFGNELFKKHISIEKLGNKKTIHLTKVHPTAPKDFSKIYGVLKKKLEPLDCKKIILDNIYRHICCCTKHKNPLIITYQRKQNKELRKFFSSTDRPDVVIDHRKFLGLNVRKLRDSVFYEKVLVDSVHLKQHFYDTIVGELATYTPFGGRRSGLSEQKTTI